MEILVVVTLLVILAIALLVTLNPMAQINKGQDSKRKSELATLTKVMEDWYNDHNCYPQPQEICYDTAVNNECHICGSESSSPPSFSPYLSRLPCDPQHPKNPYLYQTDSGSCPNWYKICASLSDGPAGYNYEVGSPNSPEVTSVPCPSGAVPTPTLSPTITPPSGPTNTPSPSPTPSGSYYCSGYGNCTWYDEILWNCSPNFAGPYCFGSNGCESQIGVCIRK